jgi:hypothetical protein
MSDYSNTFTESTGDTIDTTDFSTEFSAIETAIATKADSADPTLTDTTNSTSIDAIYDEDDMSSDDANGLATQQSIKAYVDSRVASLTTKVLSIGTWNMNSTASVNVAHGITLSKLRAIVNVLIISDTGTYYSMEGLAGGGYTTAQLITADATNITITRATNSTFETSSNFNGTGAGRGYVTIQYTD